MVPFVKRTSGKQASRKTKRQQAAALQGNVANAGKAFISQRALITAEITAAIKF